MKVLLPLVAFMMSAPLLAADITFLWDAVPDDRVAVYDLQYGTASGSYEVGTLTPDTTATLSIPQGNYFAAVRACTADKSLCSPWSNELPFVVEAGIPAPVNLRILLQVN